MENTCPRSARLGYCEWLQSSLRDTSVDVELLPKDFDGGLIGQGVVQALSTQPSASKITWTVLPASQFPGGPQEVGAAVLEEHTWVAVISCVARLSS